MSSYEWPVQSGGSGTDPNAITSLIGDVTASGPGAAATTISDNAVTTAKLSLMLQAGLSSGIISGGIVTINADPTKIDITAGTGFIVDYWTTPASPVIYNISWEAQIGVTVTNLATSTLSYIAINTANGVNQYSSFPNYDVRREVILLAQLGHTSGTAVQNVNSQYTVYQSPVDQLRDLIQDFGYINSGNIISSNGANLKLNKSSGTLLGFGVNYLNDAQNPNVVTIGSGTQFTFQYRTQTGVSTANTTDVDAANYDNGGVITAIAGSNNQATNQRIFLFPNGNIRIQYGQTIYPTLGAAIQGVSSENFVVYTNIDQSAALIGILSVTKGATDLSLSTDARFLRVSKLGEFSVGGSGVSTSTLQQAYNNSSDPEIVTDSTRGALSIKRGSAADTDIQLEVKNAADAVTFSVTGNGLVNSDTLIASRATATDASKNLVSSATTDTELGYVSGVTSAIQTQLNAKQATGNYITALTGDVTASGPGSVAGTIANDAVTNAKLGNMAANTIKGNNTGGSTDPLDLTTAQTTEMLDVMTGSQSTGLKGLAPSQTSLQSGMFLNGKGVWESVNGLRNLIVNNGFEVNLTGWANYENSVAATTPESGTGGSPSVNLARSTSSPILELASGLWSKGASDIQGEGFSYDFSIATGDQAKPMQITFDYSVGTSYVDGDMRVYIYDVSNSLLIEPSQRDILANSGQANYIGYWQSSSNSTSYRLIFHTASTSALAYDFKVDNINVSRIAVGNAGTFVSDWQSFTPTGTWTNTTYLGKYRRVGDTAEITYYLTCTGSPAGSLTIDLPSSLTIDTAKLNSFSAANYNLDSYGVYRDVSVGNYPLTARYSTTSAFTIRYYDDVAAGVAEAATFSATAPAAVVSGDIVQMGIKVPIVGWSTGVSASEISTSAVVAARASAGSTAFSSLTDLVFSTVETDTSGSYNSANGIYTIPESGFYSAASAVRVTSITLSTAQNCTISILRDSTAVGSFSTFGNGTAQTWRIAGSCSFYATKGQTVKVQGFSSVATAMNNAATDCWFAVFKVNNPAQIAPTEFVGCNYSTDAGQSITNGGSGVVVLFEDRLFDSHNAYNTSTGEFTTPVTGKYLVSAQTMFASNAGWEVDESTSGFILVNGVIFGSSYWECNVTSAFGWIPPTLSLCYTLDLVKGDIVTYKQYQNSDGAIALNNSVENYNFICITKVS